MNRFEFIEIENVKYPLCCTLGAMEEISEAVKKMEDKSASYRDTYALAVLMKYGAKRAKKFDEIETPEPLSIDDLEDMLFIDDYPKVAEAVKKTIEKGTKNEIDGRSKSKKKDTSKE